METKRKVVQETVYTDFSLEGLTLEQGSWEIINIAQKLRDKHPQAIDFLFDYSYYGYDGGHDVNILMTRFENDKEYNARIQKEQKAKEKRKKAKQASEERARKILMETEAKERKLLQELLERYPDMNESLTKQK